MGQSSRKIDLSNDISMQSISKERNKKVNFSKTVLQPLKEKNKIILEEEPAMHIRQMVSTNRYGDWKNESVPKQEVKRKKEVILNQDLTIIKRGPSKLEVKVKPEKDSSVNSRCSRKNRTQMLGDFK